jgi:3-oxoacyl-[acyl-carrier protein] reductase
VQARWLWCLAVDLGLSQHACIVTGASRGIGLATARLLAAEGASVLLVGRNPEPLEAAAEACRSAGGQAEPLVADVTAPGAAATTVAACGARFGRLDVLVNNAGTSAARPLEELTDAEWQAQWELNVMAPMRLMREAAPRMVAGGGGRIVNVGSSSGRRPSATNAAYSVTKAAELSLSKVFADAYARQGVLVNAVAPGPVATSLWMAPGGLADQIAQARGISREEAIAAMAERIPLGRHGTEDEIAAVVVFLCSPRASNVAGSTWGADGGAVPFFV